MPEDFSQETAYQRVSDAIFNNSSNLDLSNLGISEIPPIIAQTASNLQSINISRNKFNHFPINELIYLQNLKTINAEDNFIAELPADIRHFKNLKHLNLQNNSLSSLPEEIAFLENLIEINISSNKFSRFPTELKGIENLEALYINNNLENISSDIGKLKSLKTLYISANRIRTIPDEIGLLSNLYALDISHNKLMYLPDEIGILESLVNLNISGNEIQSLPRSIRKLSRLRKLYVLGNPLSLQPENESKVDEPTTIFDDHFSKSKTPFNECKILIVGEGAVGKTSLVRRLIDNKFTPGEQKTDGISISKLHIPSDNQHASGNSKTTLNFWDFGGQGIMQSTHPFFFTKRSVYLLVVDARLTQEQNRIEHWLKLINLFGDMPPVLIVGSKIDEQQLDIERANLKKKHPNITGIYETSSSDGRGVAELKTALIEQVNLLPEVQIPVSQAWLDVKNKIEQVSTSFDYITYEKYEELCREYNIEGESEQTTLIKFLHDLGVILHFQDDPRLQALGVLNPRWVTNGVYKILNSPMLFQNKGTLTSTLLDECLNSPEYPHFKRLYIVNLMERFELCYPVEVNKTFLVPDLLPKDEPVGLRFNGTPSLVYKYLVLPQNVLTRFIVRVNQRIHEGLVWRTGVVLKIGRTTALVKANMEENTILIQIDDVGQARRSALSTIMYHLDEIHDLPPKLNPKKSVPVPDKPNIEPVDYDFLLNLERRGITTYPVPDGEDAYDIIIQELLSGIEKIENENVETNASGSSVVINIRDNAVVRDIVVGKNNIQESFNKAEVANINYELKETLRQLADAINTMNKSLVANEAAKFESNYQKVVEEAIRTSPNNDRYSVSIEGLISAAEKLDKLGEPVFNLSRKVLSLLTGGIIN